MVRQHGRPICYEGQIIIRRVSSYSSNGNYIKVLPPSDQTDQLLLCNKTHAEKVVLTTAKIFFFCTIQGVLFSLRLLLMNISNATST